MRLIAPQDPTGEFNPGVENHWRTFLKRLNAERGNLFDRVSESAVLLTTLTQGVRWGIAQWKNLPTDFKEPMICLENPAFPRVVAGSSLYSPPAHAVVMNPQVLSQESVLPLENIQEFRVVDTQRERGRVYFHCSIWSKYFLTGVEEGDHAAWWATHPPVTGLLHAHKNLTPVEYDAQDHEFHALATCLYAAEQFSMREMVEIYRERIADALALRGGQI